MVKSRFASWLSFLNFEDLSQALDHGGAGRDRCRGGGQLPTCGVHAVAKDSAEDPGKCVPWSVDDSDFFGVGVS